MDAPERPPARPAWLTYAQAGERLGLSSEAVRHRARRSGWRTMPGNDGRVLVLVPDNVGPQPVRTLVKVTDRRPDRDEEIARARTRAHQAEVGQRAAEQRADAAIALAKQILEQLSRADQVLRAERARSDILREEMDAFWDRIDDLGAQIERLKAERDRTKAERDRARTDSAVLREAFDELQHAELDRRARGRWARLKAAWRAE